MKLVAAVLAVLIALQQNFVLTNGCSEHQHVVVPQHSTSTPGLLHQKALANDGNGDICAFAGSSNKFKRPDQLCQSVTDKHADPPPLEVVPLVVSGRSDNRVDLVFFSDGYTQSERAKFLEDAQRLADDITGNQTFYTVQPLMNFWAAFTPSKESGVGVGGVAKNTVYGLYRDGTELRGLYYKKPEVARAACASLGTGCDYPILLGNDPYYGGLGGEFTTVTASYLNGPLVLRHELGHSIIDVGEEYDGGYAYFGVNAIRNLAPPVSWQHWLTDTVPSQTGELEAPPASNAPRVERSVMPLQKYAWTLLNTTTPLTIRFNSSGSYSRHLVMFSLSAIPSESVLRVEMDGVEVEWTAEPTVGLDRWHYYVQRQERLEAGSHELKFGLKNATLQGRAQLCSVEVLEFGDESEFISKPGHYGLYPTFDVDNRTSYRPTNDDCLMRRVTSPNFCKVCTEGLWLSLLRDLHLIDTLTEGCVVKDSGVSLKVLELTLLPLAQFRQNLHALGLDESYTITWTRDGRVLDQYTNQTRVEIEDAAAIGTYSIDVKFSTEEVKVRAAALVDSKEYRVISRCNDD